MTKQLTESEIKAMLKSVFWDNNISPDDLYSIFIDERNKIYSIDINKIYSRLLNSYDWYTILLLVPSDKLKELLSDKTLQLLWPKSISKRYYYARRILFE